ncbi:unnamed protein product [Trifolium pratense]|uniref:Uncharacterized protein n=1 Tax=Trifolium pratense TaxID=57577 RepID=A0ACB0M7K7_TRIPR|nr:unnamed protein product [Trifolium pratense]
MSRNVIPGNNIPRNIIPRNAISYLETNTPYHGRPQPAFELVMSIVSFKPNLRDSSIGVTRYLVGQGCIKPLCDLLVCPDSRMISVCLEGLENILNVGEEEKSVGNSGHSNLYAQMIEDSEGMEKIENLQYCDSPEIYFKAVKLLETFWLEDEMILPPGYDDQFGFKASVQSSGFNFNFN